MKLKALFFWIFLASYQLAIGQYEITIDASVLNKETKQAVPYVNVGFLEKGIGTVSQSDGRFVLRYDESKINDDDVLQISSIGYKSIKLTAKELYKLLLKDDHIYIEPDIFTLEETVIIAKERQKMTIGPYDYSKKFMGYWKDKKALGGEIASSMKIRKKNTKLEKLKFYVLENYSDSLLVRVNIYKKHQGKPKTNILTSNIYHTIVTKDGEESIDLSSHNIVVNEDIIISLELVEVYGDDIGFAICGSSNKKGFVKYISQDDWEVKYGISMAFKLDISFPDSSNTIKKRKKPEDITLYWDTSLSRKKVDLETELDFLKKYIDKLKEARITLVPFSNIIGKDKVFYVKRGNSKELLSEIRKLRYNGGSNFVDLFKQTQTPDQYLVFTDGIHTYGDHKFMYTTPAFYVNSNPKANHTILQDASISNEGYYINLSKINTETAVDVIMNDIEDQSVYNIDLTKNSIQGTVFTKNNMPIQGCSVSLIGSLNEVETNANGEFSINADYDDILVFKSFGMVSKQVKIDRSKKISVTLKPKYKTLDQVYLKSKNDSRSKQDINRENEKKRIVGANFTIYNEQFPKSSFFFADVFRIIPGVQVTGFGDQVSIGVTKALAWYGTAPIFVVDGAVYKRPPIHILPSQIKSITLINSFAQMTQYGTSGGVFIITTVFNIDALEKKESTPSLLVEGNEYKESHFLLDPNLKRPAYLNALWKSDSYSNAKNIYFSLLKTHRLEVPFHIYSMYYFKRWDKKFSDQILSNLAELSESNYSVLRTLAFYLEERNEIEKALLIYEKIGDLKPHYAQSYLDLARSYKENKKYKQSFELYKRILNNDDKNIDFSEILPQAKAQFRHFLNNHRSEISYTDLPKDLLVAESFNVRIVFEWNKPLTEFELQFVDPQKKFYKWSHTFEENQELLSNRIKSGVVSEEFIIDEPFIEGEWIINIQSFEKESSPTPPLMKYTIYRNYGLSNQTKSVKVIKLYNQEQKVTLDKFVL
ncbi:carboxypeptidase-like regulatory domain-containing protein [uncultured Aquimarina sp.]|uniref:carboxypeptidase-like regulatory domain-containing protein n=1 Tax=uncultured Aquimarina sp. TaxID=575652 RepID=UPI0026309FC7|nr:carboxypeptidase-like regulatory domain-containing protein [uncultured Aquimarina sp.]